MDRRWRWALIGGGGLLGLAALWGFKRKIALPASIPLLRGSRVGPETETQEVGESCRAIVEDPGALAQASGWDLNTYALARMLASEESKVERKILVAWAARNRAVRKGYGVEGIWRWLVDGGRFGQQGCGRPAATSKDPHEQDVAVARVVIAAPASVDPTGGSISWFNVGAQLAAHKRWLAGKESRRHRHPDDIVKEWAKDGLVPSIKEGDLWLFRKA